VIKAADRSNCTAISHQVPTYDMYCIFLKCDEPWFHRRSLHFTKFISTASVKCSYTKIIQLNVLKQIWIWHLRFIFITKSTLPQSTRKNLTVQSESVEGHLSNLIQDAEFKDVTAKTSRKCVITMTLIKNHMSSMYFSTWHFHTLFLLVELLGLTHMEFQVISNKS
jgi:hypothetical protein